MIRIQDIKIIIQTTIDLINEKGEQMNAITVWEICTKANVERRLVNYHFRNQFSYVFQ